MFTEYLLNFATKGQTNYNDKNIRLRIGYLASIVGLITNIFLSGIKLFIGFMISSVSVIADGINNLSDAASSIITIIGFKLSNMPPDKEHPYGHGRLEYISALIVAFMVILVGLQFIKSSYSRIINPQVVEFKLYSFIILILSIFFKIWLSIFNKTLGEKINSSSLKATAMDSLGDVLTTSVVVISIFVGRFTTLPIDGVIGILVSLVIIYSGINLVKGTISPLIGEAPDEELIKAINKDILCYDYITGVHDLFIHNYGAGRTMATIDVEFPANIDVVEIHNIIDMAEREIGEKYNLTLVIHMDPLGFESKEQSKLRNEIKYIIQDNPIIKSMHDLQIVEGIEERIIEFHIVIDGNKICKHITKEIVKRDMERIVEERCADMKCNIIVDIEY